MSPVQRDVERILGMHKLTTTELSVLRKHAVNRGETISVELIDAVVADRIQALDAERFKMVQLIENYWSNVMTTLKEFPDKSFYLLDISTETEESIKFQKELKFFESIGPDREKATEQ